MLLAIDVGNTNTVLGLFDGDDLVRDYRVKTDARSTADEYRLTFRGLLRDDPTTDDIVEALHRYLAMTPSRLLAVSLADAVGDRKAQNQPGTDQEYPNWRVPLTDAAGRPVLLDDLPGIALLRRLVQTVSG